MRSSSSRGRFIANDPAWVPPLMIERKEFLDRKKHPFFKHGDAALFLARRGGDIVGRIMASDDPNYNAAASVERRLLRPLRIDRRCRRRGRALRGCGALASRARSRRDHGADRLLDELCLRIAESTVSSIRR